MLYDMTPDVVLETTKYHFHGMVFYHRGSNLATDILSSLNIIPSRFTKFFLYPYGSINGEDCRTIGAIIVNEGIYNLIKVLGAKEVYMLHISLYCLPLLSCLGNVEKESCHCLAK